MRDFKGMKRQRGRNRGGGGGGGSGKPQPQNANRAFDSNGPEGVKVRGNAQHVFEKYQQLARDASAAGDRVLGENYLQHAEHYFRLLRAMQPTRPASEILGRDHFSSGFDIDFEDENAQAQSEAADAASAVAAASAPPEGAEAPAAEGWQPREGGEQQQRPRDGQRDDRPRDERPQNGGGYRDDRPRDGQRGDRYENRDGGGQNRDGQGRRDRWRDDRPRDGQQRDGQARDGQPREGQQRDDRPRDGQQREDRPRYDRDDRPRDDRPPRGERYERNRDERPERDPMPVVEPQAQPLVAESRPSQVLRDADGGESHAPAFLQASTAPRADGDEAPKPRRRRAPRPAGAEPSEDA
jgi:Domain of unknown function (DUF4167)